MSHEIRKRSNLKKFNMALGLHGDFHKEGVKKKKKEMIIME